ncbi:rod shape-determining protein MreC [Secundilactobacillus paracollinoides]|uniref:Cell shape-determining protein MreC n=1 Tax=Secundilactobacillus paracollinoides TaxID=240427 RepID=A0A1B2J006_9LACO|nr:rod shape-determining protein MreC [Secundilactobacillus paracollinoides]ANZ67632.1 rod shape-determining protein MreC [Secundilactobacillus paracollinoides]KRL75969.1 rod shape-determining protein MreC [Secundilactobacillus paracollinoides DSM 15502 = JCM 11969]
MNKFFSNRRLVIVIVCLIVSFGLMSVSVMIRDKRSTPPLVQQFGNDVVGLVNRVVAWPVNGLKGSITGVSDLLNTYQENTRLKGQVQKLAQTQVHDQAVSQENKKLKKELKLTHSLTDYESVNASVIARTPSSWQDQVIIDKGSAAGIKKNMPVLSGSGMVGRVSEVNRTNSKVELLSNSSESANKFAVSITNKSGQVINGVITGYNSGSNRIEMGNVTSKKKIQRGDKVVTSGLGGVMPAGLYVGTVTTTGTSDYGLASKITIKPAADISDLSVVSVAIRQAQSTN